MNHLQKIALILKRAEKLEREFPVGSVWIHYTGRKYKILGVANIANYSPKYRPVIVYQSVVPTERAILASRLWTKSPKNFKSKMTLS